MLTPFRLLFTVLLLTAACGAAQAAPTGQKPATAPAAAAAAPAAPTISFHGTHFFVFDEGPPQGQAPDVILIPGLGCSHDVWKAEAAKLAPHFRLHLVQIRGFAGYPAEANASGPLMQPIVTELAKYIEDAKMHPAVIGHSLGGTLGLMLAAQHPQDVSKLMVVDAFPFLGVLIDPKATVDEVKPEAEQMRATLRDEPAPNFLHGENATVAGLVKTPSARPEVVFWSVNSDRHTLTNAMYEDFTTDLRPDVAKLTMPVTVLYAYDAGTESQNDTDHAFHDAYAALPHGTLIRVDDSAHFIMLDQPQKFDEEVEKFLKG
jgi:pimeloyl-ACP methyl ester carboxylesterase